MAKSRVNVCLVTETYPPEINGVAMTLATWVEGLARLGHRIWLVRPRRPELDAATAENCVGEWRVPGFHAPGYRQIKVGFPVVGTLLRAWRKTRPDVVHVTTEGPLGLAAIWAARRLGIPCTSTFHTNFHEYGAHYAGGWLVRPALAYLRWVHNRCAATLAPTEELASELHRLGFAHTGVLGRGVDIERFAPSRRSDDWRSRHGIADDALAVIHVSRLAKEKNYPLLIETWHGIQRQVPNARLVIVSDGPLMGMLRQALPEAVFTGFISRDELAVAYASCDLFPYPSETETFGNVVTEGLASGLPVLAYNYAAAGKFIRDGENGCTVPKGDDAAFTAAAIRLATAPDARHRLSQEARRTALTLSWKPIIQRFEQVLAQAARQPTASPAASS
ncbi:glycosyltransferase family 4 protein [Nibricoccus sp. IMCC34717]|uniref:glycosyltransferase family 4 protein n=1 Tax=Nibricoccus sp. IMCC34717 TaxID=3034021 RepID=UPI00384EAFA9